MKRLLIVVLIALFAASLAMAEGFFIPDAKPHMTPGTVAVSAGLNVGWGGFGVAGGVEAILGQIKIPNLFPLTYGAAARGSVSFWYGGFMYTGAGAMATIHFPWTSLALPEWAQRFDTYAGLGLGLRITPGLSIGFAGLSGLAYHFTPSFAFILEEMYLGSLGASTIGLQIKL